MKRIGYSLLSAFALATLVFTANLASASPVVNGAVITTRIFNDCPSSLLNTFNAYPASILIHDANLGCFGFANRHAWSFSADGGATPVDFKNRDPFMYCATLIEDGSGGGEAGLRLSPWYSLDVDGMFNVRSTDGEIACFGGRLPFYSFTVAFGLHYVKGTPIYMQIDYNPHDVSAIDPATIIYTINYNSVNYTSGPIAFDHGNPTEDPPHGVWGILTPARVGGHVQCFLGQGQPVDFAATWQNICYEGGTTPAAPATWGQIKANYR